MGSHMTTHHFERVVNMAAPATNGVLHTKLSDMKIGDYIWASVEIISKVPHFYIGG